MNGTAVEQYSPELPDHIIHRVQSLINPKKAAQTTLLSKSWHAAWPTRPTVDLDETYFRKRKRSFSYPKINKFAKFANTTLRRYEESNTSIETFKLCLKTHELHTQSGLATEWTLKALNLGATDLTFQLNHPDMAMLLDAVSGHKNVDSLCLQSSRIDRLKVLKIPGLKSLTLSNLNVSETTLCTVLSCCPLIENLSLYDVYNRYDEDVDDDGDGDYDDESSSDDDDDDRKQNLKQQQGLVPFPRNILLHNLRSLVLGRIQSMLGMKTLFLDNLSSKFPNLKDLTLKLSPSCFRFQERILTISSLSLEVLNLSMGDDQNDNEKKKMPRFFFDVPSIKEFTLECTSYMPYLCFTSAAPMDQCESRVSITQHGMLNAKWFLELSKLLREMRGSKIHLCLHVDNKDSLHYYQPGEINCLNVFGLENLTVNAECLPFLSFISLLDGLFRICRPKMVTQPISPPSNNEEEESDEEPFDEEDAMYVDDINTHENTVNNDVVLCRELIKGMKVKSLLLKSDLMYGLRDAEELNVQKLLDGVWRPQPLDSMLDDSSCEQSRFRFQLKWKP